MLGKITFIGKKLIRKSSDGSTPLSKKSNAIHWKEWANQNRSNTPFQDTGHVASPKSTESFTKLHPIPFILLSSATITDLILKPNQAGVKLAEAFGVYPPNEGLND